MNNLLSELHDVLDRHHATIVIDDVNPEYIVVSKTENNRTEEVVFLDSICSSAITAKQWRFTMTKDTERLDWLERNASKLGIATDYKWVSAEGYVRPEDMREYTDIRSRIDKLAEETGEQHELLPH